MRGLEPAANRGDCNVLPLKGKSLGALLGHPDQLAQACSGLLGRPRQAPVPISRPLIAFADGKVIASGTSPVEVFWAAQQAHLHPFLIRVGHEDEPTRTLRICFASTLCGTDTSTSS